MIIIPMAGLSKRFQDAGYDRPKYMLPLAGGTVFDRAIDSFRRYFDSVPFLFVCRDIADTGLFVRRSCEAIGLRDAGVVLLDAPTAGQAETVELGLCRANISDTTSITIFNIDTFRLGFELPAEPWWPYSDGYLEVFRGGGANWSYVRPSPLEDGLVVETAEKRAISDLCCSGLYHFARAGDFREALANERISPAAPELYVAPLYNHLIAIGHRINYKVIARSDISFCGVPAEYEALCSATDR
jgi:hypothetical protein